MKNLKINLSSLQEKVKLQQNEMDSLKKRVNDSKNQRRNENQVKEEKPFKINNMP